MTAVPNQPPVSDDPDSDDEAAVELRGSGTARDMRVSLVLVLVTRGAAADDGISRSSSGNSILLIPGPVMKSMAGKEIEYVVNC